MSIFALNVHASFLYLLYLVVIIFILEQARFGTFFADYQQRLFNPGIHV
jgi:hypothetical protein